MSDDAAREEAAREEEARQRAEELRANTEEAAALAAAAGTGPSPDTGPSAGAEIVQVPRSGRPHDHAETSGDQRSRPGRRRGPRR